MPVYEFKSAGELGCEYCQDGFDLLLKIAESRPSHCPKCGDPVVQVISAPFVHSGNAHRMSESHIEKHGFTQYKKAGGGVYEKTAGKGPDFISDDGK